jgi:hypothetical protein
MSVTVEAEAAEVQCPYCHKTTRLGIAGALDHMMKNTGGAASTRRGLGAARRRGILLILGVIGIGGFWLANLHFDFVPILGDTRLWHPGGCPVVGPDGERYFIGTYHDDERSHRVLLDADSGQPLEEWQHPNQTSLVCIPGGRFAIINSTLQIMVYEGAEPVIIANLPGELLAVAADDDCAAIRTIDGEDHVLPFPGRQAAGCRPEPMYPLGYRRGRGPCDLERPYALTSDLGTFALSQSSDRAGIVVVGQQSEAEAWHKQLDLTCLGGGEPHVAMAHAAEALFLILGSADEADAPQLVILDPSNGATLGIHPLPELRAPIHSSHFSGGLIIVESYDAVAGIDPVTGRVAWSYGRLGPTEEAAAPEVP